MESEADVWLLVAIELVDEMACRLLVAGGNPLDDSAGPQRQGENAGQGEAHQGTANQYFDLKMHSGAL